MGMMLAFAPFLAFVVIERLVGAPVGLAAGAAVSAVLLLRDVLSPTRRVKVLEIGTFVLFGGLAVLALLPGHAQWSVAAVRLRVDAGLLIVVLASMVICMPFTLQYAREHVPAEQQRSAQFLRTNYVITAAWAAAFGVMVLADLAMTSMPALPHGLPILATVGAIVGALKFSGWYPQQGKAVATMG